MYSSKGEEKEIYSLSNPEDLPVLENDPAYVPPEADELTEVQTKPRRKFSAAYSEEHLTSLHWRICFPVEEVVSNGQNGWLVDFFDHAALAARLSDALDG